MILLPANEDRPKSDRRIWVVCLILTLGTLVFYAPVLNHDFVNFDDGVYVADNVQVQKGLTFETLAWAFTTGHASNWHPLTWISHIIDWEWFGPKPAGHHAINLLFHVANSLLLFWLLLRTTARLWPAAMVAALFAWHPLHVESVAWLAERKDVLSTFFWLLTMLAYWRYAGTRDSSNPPSPGTKPQFYYGLTLACFVLGLLSKPMVVTLPFVLLLLDYWPLNRRAESQSQKLTWSRLVLEKLPFFALAFASSVVTFLVQRKGGAVISVEHLTLGQRVCNALLAYVGYLRKMIWPADLAVFYPLTPSWTFLQVGGAIAFLAFITVLATAWRRQRPYLLVGWLWFLGTLVPVLGLVQVGAQSMADRYTYVPLIGVFIVVAWGAAELLEQSTAKKPALAWAAAVPVLVACLVTARLQINTWKDSITLFSHAAGVTRNNIVALVNLGQALDRAHRPDEARIQFEAALRLQPESAEAMSGIGSHYAQAGDATNAVKYLGSALRTQPYLADAHFNLANVLAAQGNFTEAAAHYKEALRLKPDAPDAHNNLGAMYARQGRLEDAVSEFNAALAAKPDFPEARDQLGGVLLKLGRVDEARMQYAEAVRLRGDFVHARFRLGLLELQREQFPAAVSNFSEIVRLEPTNADAAYNLGCAYAAEGMSDPAAAAFARTIRLQPGNADAHSRLAAVFARAGRLDDAAKSYREAIRLNPLDADTHGRLAAVLAFGGDAASAVVEYREALRLKPDWPAAMRDLAWILATDKKAELRDGAEAVRLAERACQLLVPPDPRFLAALDAAFAEAGRFDDAIKTATQARQLAVAASQTNLVTQADQRVEFYRAGKPWRE